MITFTHHSLSLKNVRTGAQGRNQEAGEDAESTVGRCLPFAGEHGLTPWPSCLYNSEPPAKGLHNPAHTNHSSIKCPTALLSSDLYGAIFPAKVPLSYDQSTKTKQNSKQSTHSFLPPFKILAMFECTLQYTVSLVVLKFTKTFAFFTLHCFEIYFCSSVLFTESF